MMNADRTFPRRVGNRLTALATTAAVILFLAIAPATVEAATCAAGKIAERAGTALIAAARKGSPAAFAQREKLAVGSTRRIANSS